MSLPAGMPESVSISKQALARGYALLAINSDNRSVGSGSRCWRWVPGHRLLSHVPPRLTAPAATLLLLLLLQPGTACFRADVAPTPAIPPAAGTRTPSRCRLLWRDL